MSLISHYKSIQLLICAVLGTVKNLTFAVLDRVLFRYCRQSKGNWYITVLVFKNTFFFKIYPKSSGIDFHAHFLKITLLFSIISQMNILPLTQIRVFFILLPMIICYVLMSYELSATFLPLFFCTTIFHTTFLTSICHFENFIKHTCRKIKLPLTLNLSKNVLIFDQILCNIEMWTVRKPHVDGWLRMGLLPPPLGNFADISYLVEN